MPVSAVLLTTVVLHLMMPRRSLGTIINSVKNIVDSVQLTVAAGTNTDVVLAVAVNDYTGGVTDVPTGCVIRSLYLFVQMLPTTGTANVDWFITKNPANVTSNLPVPGATGGTPQRKYILHEEKGIPGNAADGAYPLTFKGVIRIPKGRQRMAESDVINIKLRGVDIHNICIKAIYKFYT